MDFCMLKSSYICLFACLFEKLNFIILEFLSNYRWIRNVTIYLWILNFISLIYLFISIDHYVILIMVNCSKFEMGKYEFLNVIQF